MDYMRLTLKLVENLRIMAHVFSPTPTNRALIGVKSLERDEVLYVYEWRDNDFWESEILRKKSNEEIFVNVISQKFTKSDCHELLVTTKNVNKNTFNNYFFSLEKGSWAEHPYNKMMFESTTTPIIISDVEDRQPLVVYGDGNNIKFGKIRNHNTFDDIQTVPNIRIKDIHFSTFLSLNLDFNSYLALHTFDQQNNNKMNFYSIDKNYEIILKNSINLPKSIGPVLFSEISSTSRPDMIFLSKEDGKNFINLYCNVSDTDDEIKEYAKTFIPAKTKDILFSKPIKFDLSQLNIKDVVIENNVNGINIPGGIFIADTTSSKDKEIYILDEKRQIKVLQFDKNTKKFKINSEITDSLKEYSNVESVSLSDLISTGVDYFLINVRDLKDKLIANFHPIDRELKNSFLALMSMGAIKNNYQSYFIPGTTYFIIYDSKKSFIKTGHVKSYGYPSLQMNKNIVGLGLTNLLINKIIITLPHKNESQSVYIVSSTIFPNTYSTFTNLGKKWSIKCYFIGLYYYRAIYGVVILFIVFFIIYILLLYFEPKKPSMNSLEVAKSVFDTL